MDCTLCGDTAVVFRKYEGRALCKSHFTRQFEGKVKKTIREGSMIEPGDKLCVALSGGKDSCVALKMVHKLTKDRKDVEVFALLIHEGIAGYRDESVSLAEKMCQDLGIPLHIETFEKNVGTTMDEVVKENGMACTYCGVFRRDLLNSKSRELGATKLVMGHNLDDELQSVFMNYFRFDGNKAGRMVTEPERNELFVKRIKPFRFIPEKDIGLYAILSGIEVHQSECPNAKNTLRYDVRDFLNNMEEKYPGIKFSALHSFDSLMEFVKPPKTSEVNICQCGEPCSQDKCRKCQLLADL